MTVPAASSWRPAAGWVSCAALAATLISLLVAPPPRDLPTYVFQKSVPLGDGSATLAGRPVDIVEEGGWHLPESYQYQYFSPGAGAAADLDILATYYAGPRTDAQKFPELYATRPWQPSTAVQDKTWADHATHHASGPDYAWMQIDDEHGVYLVARVSPDGHCTSTEQEVRQRQSDLRRRHPWRTLSWLFAAHPDVDQRAVWVRMTVSKRVDGAPRSPENIGQIWNEVLKAFSEQVPLSLHGDQVFARGQ